MNRFVTVSLALIVSFVAILPASAQLSPEPVECVSGFGLGSSEYGVFDQVFHIRATPADEWTALPLPDDPPEQLVPRGASNGYLVYASLVRDWDEEKMYATFYYSTDDGESWNTYEYENNDVYANATTFGIAGPYLGLRFSADTFFPWQNSRWLNLETGEVSLNGDLWVNKFIRNPTGNGYMLFVEYQEIVTQSGEVPQSPLFSASSIYELNRNFEVQDFYSVFDPMDYWNEENGGYQEMRTHRVLHLEDRSLAATDIGLFIREAGSTEWVRQENELFTTMRDVFFYDGKLYALVWDGLFEMVSEVLLMQSTDGGDSWTIDTTFENNSSARDFVLHDGDLRFRVGSGCYVLSGGTSTPPEYNQIPSGITLDPAYPNPFNPSTTISFALPEALSVSLEVYNITGQRVAILAQGLMQEGRHDVQFDASDLSSGIYMIHLQAGGESQILKVTLIK